MPGNFYSPEGDLEKYFITESWLIDQYVGDQLWVWGRSVYGKLGTNSGFNNVSTPATTFAGGNTWEQVSMAQFHTAAIKSDGSLWVWGRNQNARLGDNTTVDKLTPVTTFAGGNDWKQVSCGANHTTAIKTDGSLWIWGLGTYGRLGNNAVTDRSTPVTTFAGGTNWKQVAGGASHTAAIKTDGTLWTWGQGSSGLLGNNNIDNVSTPVTTFAGGTNWKQVSTTSLFTSAIKSDGSLWVWGRNNVCQLGINDTTNRSTPVTTFAGGTNWKQVAGGGGHVAAIKTDGTLWLWGIGTNGTLGNNAGTNRSTPVTTFAGGTNWKQVSCGSFNTAAIKTDGTLWIWGSGSVSISPQVGTNDTINRSTPVTTFAGGSDWKLISYGDTSVSAIKSGTNPELPLS